MKNLILIGMPGAGKSTLGVLLAKTLTMDFVDTDLLIQHRCGTSLSDYIAENGTEKFLLLESEVLRSLDCRATVIATGGSAVYSDEAMRSLSSGGLTVYLRLPEEEIERRISDIRARGVVLRDGATLSDIFRERAGLYEKYADITVDCSELSAERCVEKITEEVNGRL